jgi:cell division septation protein DedD
VALHPVATIAPAGPPALVQVAAVSHQEDADMLLNALKRRGYDVAIRHEPQDKLLHIQLGPFASRKDADEMRKRLLSDGYNAIVK